MHHAGSCHGRMQSAPEGHRNGHSLVDVNRDKWSIWLGTVCLGAAGLALAVPVVGWAGWLSIVFVVIALGSFIGVLVTGPIEPGKWQLRTRVTAALRPRRARKQQTRALPAPTVTDRWRFTTDVIRHPQLARIVQDGFSQPAYSRQIELTPHYVRVKAREAITDIVSPGNIRALTAVPPYIVFNDTATTEIYTLSLHDADRRPLARS